MNSHLVAPKLPSGRRPTPRPKFTLPTILRREDLTHHVWGDTAAGFVTDRVISSTDQLHVLEYELPPGGEFRHSAQNQTVFGADVMYFALEGNLILTNPQTGEVVRMPEGTGRLFHRGTWHNGFNPSPSSTVRVLEFFSPPPARGAASEFARTQPSLEQSLFADTRWDKRWPAAAQESSAAATLHEVSDDRALWRFRDSVASHLQGILVDTDYLQVIHGYVQPGHVEDFQPVSKESVLVVTAGELWLDIWSDEAGYSATTVLHPGDCAFLPVGCAERLLVRTGGTVEYLRGSGEVPDGWTP